jgi:hypothetical protein
MYSCSTFFSSIKDRNGSRDLRIYLFSLAAYNVPHPGKSPCICDSVCSRVDGEMYVPLNDKPAILFICRTHRKYAPLSEKAGPGVPES